MSTSDWKSHALKELCNAIIDCVNKTATTVEGPTPFRMIRTTNVKNGYVDTSTVKYVDEHTYKKWIRRGTPRRGDVILTREAPLGEVGLLRDDNGIFLGQRLVMYRANPERLNNRFLLYSLLSHEVQAQIKSFGSGSTVEHMRVPDCENIEITVPPLRTQCKIASILSAYDDLIENNLRRIKILEEMAQNLYREWFVKFRFPGHEKTRFIDSPLGKIPEGWEISDLGKLADQIRDGTHPGSIDPETPYLGLEHLPRMSIALANWGKASEVQSSKLLFNKGDILFGKIRPYFHKVGVAPISGVCSSDIIVVRPRTEKWFSLVLGCTSSTEFVKQATTTSQGTKMPRANWDVLVKYKIPIPPQPILSQFNKFMGEMVIQLHNFIFRNRNLSRTRDLLLPKLISGEVDVSGLDISVPDEALA